MKKGKVIRVENDIVTIGMNNGSIKEVRRCDLGFDPVLGDLVEIFEDEDQIIVTKAKKEPENHNDAGININMTNSIILTFLFAVLFGAFCGLINGVMVGWIQMPAFIVTLATMLIYRSFAQYFCQHVDKVLIGNGSSVYKMASDKSSYQMLYNMGNGKAASIPYVGIVLIVLTILFVFVTTTS